MSTDPPKFNYCIWRSFQDGKDGLGWIVGDDFFYMRFWTDSWKNNVPPTFIIYRLFVLIFYLLVKLNWDVYLSNFHLILRKDCELSFWILRFIYMLTMKIKVWLGYFLENHFLILCITLWLKQGDKISLLKLHMALNSVYQNWTGPWTVERVGLGSSSWTRPDPTEPGQTRPNPVRPNLPVEHIYSFYSN